MCHGEEIENWMEYIPYIIVTRCGIKEGRI
jgi:hypothetical protein